MKRVSGAVVGILSIAAFIGCGGVAHSLGGSDETQGTNEKNNAAASGDGNVPQVGTGDAPHGGTAPKVGTGDAPQGGTVPKVDAAGVPQGGTVPQVDSGVPQGRTTTAPSSCGSCEPLEAYGMNLAACCLDDGACGVAIPDSAAVFVESHAGSHHLVAGCLPRDQVGVRDVTCTPMEVQGTPLSACCRPDGTCGADLGAFHLGCAQQAEFRGEPPTDGGLPDYSAPLLSVPYTQMCDYPTAPDAGP
ncbi:MAG TPA: hypothetical protein VH062_35335 [Polyangiaceae bacterium]|nr:hypothetical protein [Polyangiaceae bacterium]